jgi:hypothetical protein
MNHLVLFSRHCLASLVLLWRPISAKPLAGTTLAKEQALSAPWLGPSSCFLFGATSPPNRPPNGKNFGVKIPAL